MSTKNNKKALKQQAKLVRCISGHIYDVIVLPSFQNRAFAEIELRRYYEYSRLALNKYDLMSQLEELLESYYMTFEDIKFKNDYVYGGDLDD